MLFVLLPRHQVGVVDTTAACHSGLSRWFEHTVNLLLPAVKEARLKEIRAEILNSEKLKVRICCISWCFLFCFPLSFPSSSLLSLLLSFTVYILPHAPLSSSLTLSPFSITIPFYFLPFPSLSSPLLSFPFPSIFLFPSGFHFLSLSPLPPSPFFQAHFEDNPRDLQVLRHDKVLQPTRVQPHLKHIPSYLGQSSWVRKTHYSRWGSLSPSST